MSNICDDLRAAILQAAMQGKLTEQLPEDGNAKELYATIRSNKEELIAKGVIKKEKIQQTIGELNLPNSWVSTMLGKVVTEFLVPQRDKPKKFGGNIPWCRIEDIEGKYLNGSKSGKYVDDATVSDMNLKINPVGTVICSCSASMGVQAITTIECCTNQTFMGLVCPDEIYNEFVYYYLKSLGKDFFSRIGAGTTIKYISQDKMASIAFPLPPLAEQRRIVSRIEQLMARVADLEQSADALASLKKAFPNDIKASLLQAAMQGKLTKQLPEDGSAEDLIEEIKAEKEKAIKNGLVKKQKNIEPLADIPFDIPESWRWIQLSDLVYIYSGLAYNKKDLDEKIVDEVTIFRGGNISNMSYNFKADDVKIDKKFIPKDELFLRKNQLITPAVTSQSNLGKIARIDMDYPNVVAGGFVLNIVPYVISDDIFSKLFCYFFSSPFFKERCNEIANKSGQAFYNLNRTKLQESVFPMPPLDEQKRIVERLDTLMQKINVMGDLIASE